MNFATIAAKIIIGSSLGGKTIIKSSTVASGFLSV